jgi:hypothetical protein
MGAAMSPTPEVSERQRKAAFKAWETIRRKASGNEAPGSDEKKSRSRATKASDYPENWKQIVAEILNRARNEQSQEQCECHGECLKHHGRCEEINRTWPKHRRRKGKVKIRLTIAHLCHTPKCDNKSHLRAMCEPCHLIYDLRCRQQSLQGDQAVEWAMQQGQKR